MAEMTRHNSRARQRCALVWVVLPLVLGSLPAGTPRSAALSARTPLTRGVRARSVLLRATLLGPEPSAAPGLTQDPGPRALKESPLIRRRPDPEPPDPEPSAALETVEVIARPDQRSGLRRRVIKKGDYVVHRDLGIALFRGVLSVKDNKPPRTPAGERPPPPVVNKFLVLEFANEEIELPTAQQHMLTLYRRADEATLRPVRLASTKRVGSWQIKKAKARFSLKALTVGILEAYRERGLTSRPTCAPDGLLYADFVANCSFTLTGDQEKSCKEIEVDMVLKAQPMDRLLCGDVGFGKTEVAMRAIFRTAASGRQAAVLAPTTVLAWQHHATMRNRFPTLNVSLLTRLTPVKQARLTLEALEAGEIDVLVGTHSILSKRVAFKDLGLMIVDEEHRFGVNQKEKVKALSVKVDYLTMSATPIPRTLSLGLSALRDMSVLNEPPLGRLPVKTLVDRYSPKLIENAISAELARGGQVFYVVPRIAHVEPALRMLELIFGPDLSTEWAHGQCTDLEERMLRFANGTARVLVSTSVVECGIDMPNVNTLLVQDAHMFGLASLHQLRGRVGRSSVQAYAHLMTNGEARLTPEASSRLRALKEFSALGDGFELAQADMALRGCGNLLGPEQSGQINDMGAEYFFEMLEEAIDNARKLAEKGDAQEADYGANYVPNGSGRS
mmetsp:Transcript_20061/g.47088  ORF Transcript_20061/g.47088 Transcript_20061/m.47088 type:complete len:673 (-) Transcript_20061:416-2434(-)